MKWHGILRYLRGCTVADRRIQRIHLGIRDMFPSGATVLDVGAGNGILSRSLAEARPDLSIRGIDTLLWPDPQIEISEYDGTTIPLNDRMVDYCLASDMLHHCENPLVLLREMTRVASTGIVIKDHIANNALDRAFLGFLDWAGNSGYNVKLTYEYMTWRQWSESFESLGLEIAEVRKSLCIYPPPFNFAFDRGLQFVCHLKLKQ